MQITIDTSKDSPEDIRKAIRFLQDLLDGKGSQSMPGNSGNIFDTGTGLDALSMMDAGQASQANANSQNASADSASSPVIRRDISSGRDGAAQKIINSARDEKLDENDILGNPLSKKDKSDKDKSSKEIAPGVIVY